MMQYQKSNKCENVLKQLKSKLKCSFLKMQANRKKVCDFKHVLIKIEMN